MTITGHLSLLTALADYGPATLLLVGIVIILGAVRLWSTRGRSRLPLILAALGLCCGMAGTQSSPIAPDNAALTGDMSLVWIGFQVPTLRLGVNAPGDAPPTWWYERSGACAAQVPALVSDVGSCNNNGNGNSWVAAPYPSSGADVREWGAIGVLPSAIASAPYNGTLSGSNATDSTAAWIACLNAAGKKGECVGGGMSYYIAGNLTLPLEGNTIFGGHHSANVENNPADYATVPGLWVDSGHSIIGGAEGQGVIGYNIYRAGMTFPATDSSLYAGTLLSDGGYSDFRVDHDVLIGGDKCLSLTGGRDEIGPDVWPDCNGGEISTQTASGSFSTANASITMAANVPSSVQAGYLVLDATTGYHFLGTVSSGAGTTTLVLAANSLDNSAGTSDVLVFYPNYGSVTYATGNTDSSNLRDLRLNPLGTGTGSCAADERTGNGIYVGGTVSFVSGLAVNGLNISHFFEGAQVVLANSIVLNGTIWTEGNQTTCPTQAANSIGVLTPYSSLNGGISLRGTGLVDLNNSNTGWAYFSNASRSHVGAINLDSIGGDGLVLGETSAPAILRTEYLSAAAVGLVTHQCGTGPGGCLINAGNGSNQIGVADLRAFTTNSGSGSTPSAAPIIWDSTGSTHTIGAFVQLSIGHYRTDISGNANPFSGFSLASGSDPVAQENPVASVSCTGTNITCASQAGATLAGGNVLLTSGTGGGATSITVTVNFSPGAANLLSCGPGSIYAGSAAWPAGAAVVSASYTQTVTSATFTITTSALAASKSYGFSYQCRAS